MAATAARKIVRGTCADRGLPTGLVEDAALVAGVLVTHSVRQAHSRIRLLVEVGECAVLVRVEDESGVLPPAAEPAPGTGGYGLAIVGRLARGSGFVRTRTGRQGWALLAQSGATDTHGLDGLTMAVA
jgi:anti-sigma regulatory factor (Ser/Thr protein kinase)